MKKSKIIFAVVAVVVIALCVCLMLLQQRNAEQEVPAGTTDNIAAAGQTPQATTETLAPATELDDVSIPTLPVEEVVPIVVSENVTIYQVEKKPNEVIDRTSTIDASHPEYIDVYGGDPYWSVEGKVCRNDKTISIEVMDDISGDCYTITFGYITGGCNRFLYLNPIVQRNENYMPCYIHLDTPIGGGYTVTLAGDIPENSEIENSYTFRRAREQREFAQYVDPKHPGAVWYPQQKLDGPVYLDMILANAEGNYIATLRLIIDKAKDGTYSFVDIDNLNLIQDNTLHPEYTQEELTYIAEIANEAYMDPEVSGLTVLSNQKPFTLEKCIIEYRDQTNGLYYRQFFTVGGRSAYTGTFVDQQLPILAVTYRQVGFTSHTFYLQVVSPPRDGEHGTYVYIGRDYPLYNTTDILKGYGWDGIG